MERNYEKISTILIIAILGVQLFNMVQMASMQGMNIPTGIQSVSASVVPTGVPMIYGSEMGIRYDDINPNDQVKANKVINMIGNFDRTMSLTGKDLDRYIKITSEISCEYCCGATSIIFRKEDIERINQQVDAAINAGKITEEQAQQYRRNAGEAACGCAHSYAMRGLAKYLIKNHGTEFTDDEILEELGKWKTLFFPTQMEAKAQALKENGIEFNYINLGSNKYRGIEQGKTTTGNMVGGC